MMANRKNLACAALACGLLAACTYNPPPEVTLTGPTHKNFVIGEPVTLEFSESVRKDSLEVIVWPGQKDLYDLEGGFLPSVEPLMELCTIAQSPCGENKDVVLTLSADRTSADLTAAPGSFGDAGQPLVMEVTGNLADDEGHKKGVSRLFDFQMVAVRFDPYADVVEDPDAVGGEVVEREPLNVTEGEFLFFAEFQTPMYLPQQFWCDVQVNQKTGDFVMILIDGDPIDAEGIPKNTSNPDEIILDSGDEAFLFTQYGKAWRDGENLVFEAEPVQLVQTIGPIHFGLVNMVTAGIITEDHEDGLATWDGTIYVESFYMEANGQRTDYPADQANFNMTELKPAQVPDTMTYVCDDDPCVAVGGRCDLLDTWPPESVCGEATE